MAITDSAAAARVRAAGAVPTVVSRSEATPNVIKEALDRRTAPQAVTGWYVDVTRNAVVFEALRGGEAAARAFAAGVRDADARQVRVVDERPSTFYDFSGGDAYYIGNGRCSVGFAVAGGFVTAGHCGSSEAPIGAAVCRSGSTTGWRCGYILAKNQAVRYVEGVVSGLTRTDACAEPGDSGGPWVAGNQAQGVTSGGAGNCTFGGVTFFQPVDDILSAYGLRLTTA